MVCFVQVGIKAINMDLVKSVRFPDSEVILTVQDDTEVTLTGQDAIDFKCWWAGHSGVHICPGEGE